MNRPIACLNLTVLRSAVTGDFYVTSESPRGLLVQGPTLAEALSRVPMVLAELREAGEHMPNLEGVPLP